jgi:UDP-N-acetyl-alpha-D-muramoyl-L-alanyl-L-glutamate epimerase
MENSNYKIENLRKKYPKFVYEKFSYKFSKNNLVIVFSFKIDPNIKFRPKIIIENTGEESLDRIGKNEFENFIFNLGLMEIPSYWKATCSKVIEINAGDLNETQIIWWKKIFIDGMGQFYFENKIDFTGPDFLKIISTQPKNISFFTGKLKNRYLVPFAGGRDSIVTLEKLKKLGKEISLFTVNPIEKIQKTVTVSGVKNQIIVRRIVDKKLLELNKKGFLNGHTPFTSLLSFLSVFCAVIFDYKNIAFSNEKSANEGNTKYLGKTINHQWAKSSEFEKAFKIYCNKFLAKNINYYSFIRKYGELEISKILSGYKQYFPVFSSCNAGMKINYGGALKAKERWCGNCPKCLFVYLSLFPYLKKNERLEIFGVDIFENKSLLITAKNLLEKKSIKPLECVGTRDESEKALELSLKRAKKEGKIPFILKRLDKRKPQ